MDSIASSSTLVTIDSFTSSFASHFASYITTTAGHTIPLSHLVRGTCVRWRLSVPASSQERPTYVAPSACIALDLRLECLRYSWRGRRSHFDSNSSILPAYLHFALRYSPFRASYNTSQRTKPPIHSSSDLKHGLGCLRQLTATDIPELSPCLVAHRDTLSPCST